MVEMKYERNFTNKKLAAIPTFCKRSFSKMHHIAFIYTLLSVLSRPLGMICTTGMWPRFETEEWALTQSTDKINMVHPRKFSLAESWVSSRFFICKISFIFHFNIF